MYLPPTATISGRLTPVEVARSLQRIPSAPAVLARLSAALHGESSFSELAHLVRLDPGLAAEILRARRGQRSAPHEPCFTLEDAINALGAEFVQPLVENVSRTQIIDQPLEVYSLDMDEFWRWSIATALSAEHLAEIVGEDVDLSFAIGLLHNVGMVAVAHWARQHAPELIFAHRSWPREYSAAEGAILGFTHAEVGGTLLQSWDFPSSMTEAIRAQYVPLRFGPHARRSCLLHTAKWLAAAVCTEEAAPKLPESAFLDVLRIPSYELLKMVVEIRVRIGHVRNAVEAVAA